MSQIIVLAILILINAFFAATEIAFISLNDAKIEKQAKEGNKKAKQIKKMLREPSKFLATIQIGITLAGFLSSAFAADAFADDLAPMLQNLIPLGLTAWRNISIILITIILSYFSLIFGELVPKRLAMRNSEKIAFGTIGIIRTISIITAPFVKLLTASTNGVSKLFGISGTDEETVTEEEIRMMVDVGEEKGSIKEEERELINNVFEFNDKVVSEIMIHRKDIYAIDINSDIDNILKELDKKEKVKIAKIIREPYFVSENKPIDELFRDLQKNKHQLAIVLDEYGGTAGLVTMEDIIEELVGNIFDEYDEEEKEFEKIDDNTFLISGSVSIHDLRKILGVEIPEGEYDTLSGYLIELLGRIPSDDEKPVIETKRVTYKIEDYEEKRILWVKACRNNVEEDNDDENDEEDSKTSKEDTEKSED